jgi:DNA replication protein DnaC
VFNDKEIDALPGNAKFKKAIKDINSRLGEKHIPRPQDPFEDDLKYLEYLQDCGYPIDKYMTPAQLTKAEEQRAAKLRRAKEEQERRAAVEWERQLIMANIPEMHRGCSFESYETTNDVQRECVERLQNDKRNWFVLCGSTGTGKNHLATAVIKDRLKSGRTAVLWKVKRLMDEQLARSGEEKRIMLRELETVDLLVLNELGRTSEKKFFQDTIFDLLDERHENNRQTILITNMSPEQVFALFEGDAVQRRLRDSYVYEFNWPTWVPKGQAQKLFNDKEVKA